MRLLEIKGTIRKDTGKKYTKKLREEGYVPCVLYGGEKNIHFSALEKSFKDLVYTHHVHIINLDLEGNSYKAILRNIQFHPVTDKIQHIDFVEVFEDVPTIVEIPVELTGNSIGLKNGGKVRQRRRSLKVKGLIKDMPDTLEIDMTDIDIGDYIKIGDLLYDNLEILTPARVMVVGVVSSRVAAKSLIEAEEDAAAAAAARAEEEEVEEAKEEKPEEAAAEAEGAPSDEEKKSEKQPEKQPDTDSKKESKEKS